MRRTSPYDGHSDEDLVQMCIATGDRPAWDALILRRMKFIYSIAVDCGFDDSDSRDVTQNVCVKLFKGLHLLRDGRKVHAWLITTTKRECFALARRKRRDIVPEGETEEPCDPARTLEEILISGEKQQSLRHLLAELGSPCGPLLEMLYFEELSYKEVGARLGISHDGIGAKQARCVEKFRSMLGERGITNL